ncbi:hypothetical protein [Pontibacter beigongshangensis]|uniref:hypothetical protein n=1 Tax=Pontibacter beigongshangensis TaxID=2574733 RepID=UPI001650A747|nr:hypothetical protein [Pontibacter beigongshangensis]
MPTTNQPPHLVLNQHTNRYINIQPYLNYLHERCHDKPAQLNDQLEKLIRFVSLYFDSQEADSTELKNALAFLFDIKDMFASMQEFKSA